jgi:hypothetical protein
VLSQAEALAKAEALAIMVISGPAPKRRGDIALLQPMLHAMLHAMPEKYKFLPPRTMPTCASLGTACGTLSAWGAAEEARLKHDSRSLQEYPDRLRISRETVQYFERFPTMSFVSSNTFTSLRQLFLER